MARFVLVQSNWTCINSLSLDLVCDVDIEEKNQLTTMDEQEEEEEDRDHDDVHLRKTTSSDETIASVTLRSNEIDKREDPVITLSILQPNEYQIVSIQFLSSAKHIEFYQQEYIGSCQGSRLTELDSESIYESTFEFNQSYEEITLKCLKLADVTELIVYCLQVNMKSRMKSDSSALSAMNLPFDLNRVRSMIDETHLSSNARQFMNGLQHIQEQRHAKETSSPQFNLGQFMSLMTGMKSSTIDIKQASPTSLTSTPTGIKSSVNEVPNTYSQGNDKMKQNVDAIEHRLQTYIDQRFVQLQQHIDQRFDRLEEQLTKLNKNV